MGRDEGHSPLRTGLSALPMVLGTKATPQPDQPFWRCPHPTPPTRKLTTSPTRKCVLPACLQPTQLVFNHFRP